MYRHRRISLYPTLSDREKLVIELRKGVQKRLGMGKIETYLNDFFDGTRNKINQELGRFAYGRQSMEVTKEKIKRHSTGLLNDLLRRLILKKNWPIGDDAIALLAKVMDETLV